MVKNLPAMEETRVQSLGQEDPLEKGIATHSSILAWRSPWTEESGITESDTTKHAGQKRGVAGLLLGRTERAARAAELQLCAQAR